jgi:hypothetical protein
MADSPGYASQSAPEATWLNANILKIARNEAIAFWTAQDIAGPSVDRLRSVDLRVGELPGSVLGVAGASEVVVDSDGAGFGWSITGIQSKGGLDLFSAVAHEFGHVLGLDHDAPYGVMASTLTPTTRTLPPPPLIPESFLLSGSLPMARPRQSLRASSRATFEPANSHRFTEDEFFGTLDETDALQVLIATDRVAAGLFPGENDNDDITVDDRLGDFEALLRTLADDVVFATNGQNA